MVLGQADKLFIDFSARRNFWQRSMPLFWIYPMNPRMQSLVAFMSRFRSWDFRSLKNVTSHPIVLTRNPHPAWGGEPNLFQYLGSTFASPREIWRNFSKVSLHMVSSIGKKITFLTFQWRILAVKLTENVWFMEFCTQNHPQNKMNLQIHLCFCFPLIFLFPKIQKENIHPKSAKKNIQHHFKIHPKIHPKPPKHPSQNPKKHPSIQNPSKKSSGFPNAKEGHPAQSSLKIIDLWDRLPEGISHATATTSGCIGWWFRHPFGCIKTCK